MGVPFSKTPRPGSLDPNDHQQARRILHKFGGARRLCRILDMLGRSKDPATIYKWTYSRERGGTGGLIPTAAWPDILAAARFEGIHITPEDIDPRTYPIQSTPQYPGRDFPGRGRPHGE